VAFRFSFVFRRIFMREHNVYALVRGIKTSSAYKNSEHRHSCAEPKMRGNRLRLRQLQRKRQQLPTEISNNTFYLFLGH